MEQDKRLRREIANSNERRRMESINAGFAGLKNLLPQVDTDKLSKAAILQQTSDYIYQLVQEKNRLLGQNSQLKKMLSEAGGDASGMIAAVGSPQPQSPPTPATEMPLPKKRRKTVEVTESGDEGLGSMSPEHNIRNEEVMELRREAMDLRLALERERRHRIGLEEHIAMLQQQHTMFSRKLESEQSEDQDEDGEAYGNRIVHDATPRCYTVRNNLETIVEAIRQLEGDLFQQEIF